MEGRRERRAGGEGIGGGREEGMEGKGRWPDVAAAEFMVPGTGEGTGKESMYDLATWYPDNDPMKEKLKTMQDGLEAASVEITEGVVSLGGGRIKLPRGAARARPAWRERASARRAVAGKKASAAARQQKERVEAQNAVLLEQVAQMQEALDSRDEEQEPSVPAPPPDSAGAEMIERQREQIAVVAEP